MAAEEEEVNEQIRSFVCGILTNLGEADPAFIESKLMQFIPDYAKTRAGLVALLGQMCQSGELVSKGGNVYGVA